jgi:hypothetical protein
VIAIDQHRFFYIPPGPLSSQTNEQARNSIITLMTFSVTRTRPPLSEIIAASSDINITRLE